MKKIKLPTVEELKAWALSRSIVVNTIEWSKNRSLPGFAQVPIYDVTVFLYNETRRYDLFTRANSMAFSFFLSLFPSLISLFTLLPYVRRYLLSFLPDDGANFDDVLQAQIQEVIPGNVGATIFQFIDDLTTNPRVGLLSFGFILALFFASNGMIAMMRGFEKSYLDVFHKRGGIKKRIIAILLTFQLGVLLISSVILIILGNLLIGLVSDLISLDIVTTWAIYILRWFVIIALFYTFISLIYRYGVSMDYRARFFSPGATLATVLSISSSIAFSFYVDNFGRYNELYGGFGTIIVTMLWIQLNSLILLLGFELNASIAVNRSLLEEVNPEETDEDY